MTLPAAGVQVILLRCLDRNQISYYFTYFGPEPETPEPLNLGSRLSLGTDAPGDGLLVRGSPAALGQINGIGFGM